MASGILRGFVLGVMSGDTLLISAIPASDRVPLQKVIKLSNVTAPQLGWKERADEPFAWQARDALRLKCLGEEVTFRIQNDAAGGGKKSYGEVFLRDERLAVWVAANGWGRVREVREDARDEAYATLKAAEDAAIAGHLGMFTEDAAARASAVRPIVGPPASQAEFFAAHGGKPLDVIVDQVRTGSTLRLIMLPSFVPFTLFLAGIRCPGYKRAADSDVETAEPFADEAKYYVERRLLHRTVQVVLEFPDDHGNYFGTVLHPRGNIAEMLVRDGYARVVDWAAAHVTYAPALRAAETAAKAAQARCWHGFVPVARSVAADASRFSGVVVEVPSGDCVIVLDAATNRERRVYLSSVRAPRLRGPNDRAEPWAFEAREFVRKRCIGKSVEVAIDYMKRPDAGAAGGAAGGAAAAAAAATGKAAAATTTTAATTAATAQPQTDRFFATVMVGEKNVATGLIGQGFATVVRHRDDDERSHHYDELMAAQAKAQKSKVGCHSGKEAPQFRRVDTSGDAGRASLMIDQLRANGRVPAVVDFVSSGCRFKLFLVNEGVFVPFNIAGVRCARTDQNAPWSGEALAFAKRHMLHRDIFAEFQSIDKRGTFMGQLFAPDKTSYAGALLSAGLGWLEGYGLDTLPYIERMREAEASARAAKRAYWSTYVEPVAAAAPADEEGVDADAPASPSKRAANVYDVRVSHVVDSTLFFAQVLGEPVAKLEALMARLAEHFAGPGATGGLVSEARLKVGTFVAAQSAKSKIWYRAKIVEVIRAAAAAGATAGAVTYRLQFIDYGDERTVGAAAIRELPAALLELPPQAHCCKLALTLPANDADLNEEARTLFMDRYVNGTSPLVLTVELDDKGASVWHVSLFQDTTSVAVELLALGLVRVDRNNAKLARRMPELAEALREAEAEAIENHEGMWQYGEIDYDEPPPPSKAAAATGRGRK